MDLAPVISHHEYRYYVTFIDDFTRFTWLFPLAQKIDVYNVGLSLSHKYMNRKPYFGQKPKNFFFMKHILLSVKGIRATREDFVL